MMKPLHLLVLILLVLTSSCDLFKPDAPEARWITSETYDFPIYVGGFAGYVHTDAEANLLGNVNYGGAGDGKDWQVFEYLPDDLRGQPQTPELSFFTATLTEEGQVRLAWVTESETQMLGFRLYRSDTNDIPTAQEITNEPIPATNISETHVYYYTDTTVIPGNIYYYWLEYVFTEYPSTFHGPVMIDVSPATNWVSAAYPNPCQDSFKLSVDVKVGTTATMLLLDQAHTIRKTKTLGQGSEQLITTLVGDIAPGLYRVYIWFRDGHYSYGDVLIER